ncbi:MAG: MmcQ/YjbR family DNA-binding protein [Clostridiales bacterium]|nr:MmcQ/YjbR family DNA-binding protein [Clostridiales bacterium]
MLKQDIIEYCLKRQGAYEDYPFDDSNWTVMRHKGSRKSFAFIYEHRGRLCVNLKCEPGLAVFLREQYRDVIPGYHTNKTHWNTVTPGGDVPDRELLRFIDMSYDLTKPKR